MTNTGLFFGIKKLILGFFFLTSLFSNISIFFITFSTISVFAFSSFLVGLGFGLIVPLDIFLPAIFWIGLDLGLRIP